MYCIQSEQYIKATFKNVFGNPEYSFSANALEIRMRPFGQTMKSRLALPSLSAIVALILKLCFCF